MLMVNRSANASWNGDNFQIVAAISLLVDNIYDFTFIKCEHEIEDIVVGFADGSIIAAQSKASFDVESSHALDYFDKGLLTLTEASESYNCRKQIYITNIDTMLGSSTNTKDFLEYRTIWFDELSRENRDIIKSRKLGWKVTSSFGIQHLKYTGENKEKWIRTKVRDVLREIDSLRSLNTNRVFDQWKIYLSYNSGERNRNIVCNREKMIWGIIVQRVDSIDSDICDESDDDYSEVVDRYSDTIDSLTGEFPIFSRICGDFIRYRLSNPDCDYSQYSESQWEKYHDIVDNLDIENRLESKVLKVLIQMVLRRSELINNIRQELNV